MKSWSLDLFETKYSTVDLERFGEKAEAAIDELDPDFFGGYAATSFDRPDVVFVFISDDVPLSLGEETLERTLPDDSYEIDVGEGSRSRARRVAPSRTTQR